MHLQPCYFYHIPKTGGMSTWQLIEWLYPEGKICPGRMWEDIIHIPIGTLNGYDAFRGHFLSYLEPYLHRKLTTFTVLRDPVQRTISHYYHARRAPEHPFHSEAQTLSLAEFCTHPRTRHMVYNYQAGYLACPGRKDPRELSLTMTQNDLARYRLQLMLDPAPDEFPPPDELYRMAHDRLRSFAAVGITEQLQQSLVLIARRLGAPDPPEFGMRNVGPDRVASLDGNVERIIRRCTEVDHALYSDERGRFEQVLKELQAS